MHLSAGQWTVAVIKFEKKKKYFESFFFSKRLSYIGIKFSGKSHVATSHITQLFNWLRRSVYMLFSHNPLTAFVFCKMYFAHSILYFRYFITAQIMGIFHFQRKKEVIYRTSCLPISWWHQEPGHQQDRYWPNLSVAFRTESGSFHQRMRSGEVPIVTSHGL